MRFELIVATENIGYRWISHDIEKDYPAVEDDDTTKILLAQAIIAKMADSRERASRPVPPPEPPSERDLARIKAKGHDCFTEENEVITIHGNSTYTHCAICGDAISAG